MVFTYKPRDVGGILGQMIGGGFQKGVEESTGLKAQETRAKVKKLESEAEMGEELTSFLKEIGNRQQGISAGQPSGVEKFDNMMQQEQAPEQQMQLPGQEQAPEQQMQLPGQEQELQDLPPIDQTGQITPAHIALGERLGIGKAVEKAYDTQEAPKREMQKLSAKRVSENIQKIDAEAKGAKEQNRALDFMKGTLDDIQPFSAAAFADALPDFNLFNLIKKPLLNPSASAFKSAIKAMFKQGREIFGSQFSNYEAGIFGEMLPEVGRDKTANLAVIDFLEKMNDVAIEKQRISEKIMEHYGGNPPYNFNSLVEKHSKPAITKILNEARKNLEHSNKVVKARKGSPKAKKGFENVMSPDGNVFSIPKHQIESSIKQGGTIL